MDKQTAIDLLDNLLGMVEDNHESDYDTAIHMGIDALKSNAPNALSALDCIERQATIDALCDNCDTVDAVCAHIPCKRYISIENLPSVQTNMSGNMSGTHKSLDCISRQMARDALNQLSRDNFSLGDWFQTYLTALIAADDAIQSLPSVQPEIIRCCDCIYYDPEHIEKNGVRYEYRDMPKDAFDILGTGLVNSEYGINVGGRCCRDYNVGYSEDKRVFVSGQNYCGRAERRQDG